MSTFNRKRQIMEHEPNVQDEIDTMWQQAMRQSIEEGEMFTRYHFAKLIAQAEREACAKLCDDEADDDTQDEWNACNCCTYLADKIRARGDKA